MNQLDRRTLLTGPALLAAAALSASVQIAFPTEREHELRALLVGNVRRAMDELAASRDRGDRPEVVRGYYEYGLRLDLIELRLFDRGEGEWRELYGLPLAPGAFTGSAVEWVA